MSDLSKIDKNFKVETKLDLPDVKFYDPKQEPFTIYGLTELEKDGFYHRMPSAVAESVGPNLVELNVRTAGGRVAFKTDSPYVTIKAVRRRLYFTSDSTQMMQGGFDMYVRRPSGRLEFVRSFTPPAHNIDEYDSKIDLSGEMRDFVINFPLYGRVESLYIGVKEGSRVEKTDGYRPIAPIVYYGSSITQGGCAARPGTNYAAMLSHKYNLDYVNLGFSGNAKGEKEVAEYIASLNMSVFVYDYDHNSPSAEHLAETHPAFLDVIRKAQPDLPVICMPRPGVGAGNVRRDIIKKTVDDRIAMGDKNIWFIDGTELVPPDMPTECTVDGCHPTDLGFYFMAKAVEKRLKEILDI